MKILTVIAPLVIALTVACSSNQTKLNISSDIAVTGKVGEILVVCDQDLWESDIKKHLDTQLTRFIMPYYPDVATFELIHKTPKKFTQGDKRRRNALFVDIEPGLEAPHGVIRNKGGVWATDQLVIELAAPTYNSLLALVRDQMDTVHAVFDQKEWQRLVKFNKQRPNKTIDKQLAKSFGIHLDLPDGAKVLTRRPNFYRISFPDLSRPIEFVGTGGQDEGAVLSGIMVYQYDFIDSSQLELEALLQARDTMLKYNVPHEFEGMYMGTQYVDLVYPEMSKDQSIQEVSGYEMRGMFKFLGRGKHGTGGAFWGFHFVHPERKKLVCVSGYVDAPPTTSWTHPLRVLQSVWKSTSIVH